MQAQPLFDRQFGLLIRGLDLLQCCKRAEINLLRSLLHEKGVLAFPEQRFSSAVAMQQAAELFGDGLLPVNVKGDKVQLYISKGRGGDSSSSAQPSDDWHHDNSYNEQPAAATCQKIVARDPKQILHPSPTRDK